MRLFMRTGLRLAVVLALASGAQARAGFMFQTIDVPGASETTAWGINGRGQVVGRYSDSGGVGHGFLASGGVYAPIDVPGAALTAAFGINGDGQVVGRYGDRSGIHGFLASGGVYAPIDVPGASSTVALGINGRGQIVGLYEDSGGAHGFLATQVVPEPSGLVLIATGAVGLLGYTRFRRKDAASDATSRLPSKASAISPGDTDIMHRRGGPIGAGSGARAVRAVDRWWRDEHAGRRAPPEQRRAERGAEDASRHR